MRHRRRKLHNS